VVQVSNQRGQQSGDEPGQVIRKAGDDAGRHKYGDHIGGVDLILRGLRDRC
jgi:hypothetical protein